MKRTYAILFALTLMVSGMATMAEEAPVATTEVNVVTETVWTAPFEDGDWLSVEDLHAEVYLPTGWTVTDAWPADEETAAGFIAANADNTETMTAKLEPFVQEEVNEEEGATLSAFETYLLGLGQDYELALMGEQQAAILTGEEDVSVLFVQDDKLITLTFAPNAEDGAAASALAIAETFYVYDVEESNAAVVTE